MNYVDETIKNICYNCSYCKDIEVDVYYCSYDHDCDDRIITINPFDAMCKVGLDELCEKEV